MQVSLRQASADSFIHVLQLIVATLEKKNPTTRSSRKAHIVSATSERDQTASVSIVAIRFPRFQVFQFQSTLRRRMAAVVIGQQNFYRSADSEAQAKQLSALISDRVFYKVELID